MFVFVIGRQSRERGRLANIMQQQSPGPVSRPIEPARVLNQAHLGLDSIDLRATSGVPSPAFQAEQRSLSVWLDEIRNNPDKYAGLSRLLKMREGRFGAKEKLLPLVPIYGALVAICAGGLYLFRRLGFQISVLSGSPTRRKLLKVFGIGTGTLAGVSILDNLSTSVALNAFDDLLGQVRGLDSFRALPVEVADSILPKSEVGEINPLTRLYLSQMRTTAGAVGSGLAQAAGIGGAVGAFAYAKRNRYRADDVGERTPQSNQVSSGRRTFLALMLGASLARAGAATNNVIRRDFDTARTLRRLDGEMQLLHAHMAGLR